MERNGQDGSRQNETARTMHVEVLAPQAVRWSGSARSVVLPGTEGGLGVRPGRQPVMTGLTPGDVRIQDSDGAWHRVPIGGGFATVTGDRVEVLDC